MRKIPGQDTHEPAPKLLVDRPAILHLMGRSGYGCSIRRVRKVERVRSSHVMKIKLTPLPFAAFAALALAVTSAFAEPPSSGVKPSDDVKKAAAEATKEKETDKAKDIDKDADKAKSEDKAKARSDAESKARDEEKALKKETVRENADVRPASNASTDATAANPKANPNANAADRDAGSRNQTSNAKPDSAKTGGNNDAVKPAEERPRDPQ